MRIRFSPVLATGARTMVPTLTLFSLFLLIVGHDLPGGGFAGGLLVGFGTRLGSGCTSGHGVCGLGRLSIRSLAATVTFMAVGVATVFVFRHLLGVA